MSRVVKAASADTDPPPSRLVDTGALARFLRDNPEWVNTYDNNGETLLHTACRLNCSAAVRTLIAAGASLDRPTQLGLQKTPLGVACKANSAECAAALYAAGAALNDIYPHALQDTNIETLRALLDAGLAVDTTIEDIPLLNLASLQGSARVVRELLSRGLDGRKWGPQTHGALHIATQLPHDAGVGVIDEMRLSGRHRHSMAQA